MRVVRGKARLDVDTGEFARRSAGRDVVVDVGCGDGLLPYRLAGEHPAALFVGFDPNAESMEELSGRAARAAARGGRENLLLAQASAESPPPELLGVATVVSVNFPWAGLRDALRRGDPVAIGALASLGAPDCLLQLLLNAVDEGSDADPTTPEAVRKALAPTLERAGFEIGQCDWLPAGSRVASRWGGRLIAGRGRAVVHCLAQRGRPTRPARMLAAAMVER